MLMTRMHMEFTRRLEPTFRMQSRWSRPYTISECILYLLTTLSWHLASKRNGGNDPSVGFIMEIPQEAGPITFGSLIVGYQGHEFELRTLYDIVAWIFSVVGNVPDQAKRETYYYPLMMIASVFCQKLISKNKTAEVWSVMWFKQTVNNRQVTRVILGANLDNPAKNLKVDTKNFRKDVLRNAQVLLWDGLPPAQTEEPSGVVVGADFGHCAETYPLLFICR